MLKHAKKYIKILLAVFILMLSMPSVKAATARISASSKSVYVGDSVTITATYTAAAWNLTISGNGVTTAKYADVTADAENATRTASVKLNTSKAGTYTVKLTGDITDGTTGDTTNVNTSVSVTVKEKPVETPKATTTNDSNANSGNGSNSGNSSSSGSNSSTRNGSNSASNSSSGSSSGNSGSSNNSSGSSSGSKNTATTPSTASTQKSTSTQKNTSAATSSNNTATKTTTSTNTNNTNEEQNKTQETIEQNTDEVEEAQEEVLPFGISKLELYGINEKNEKSKIELTPAFDINTFEYQGKVESNINKIEIAKDANNYDEYLEIIGLDEELKEGKNVIILRMKKDDSNVEYKIIVEKEASKDTTEEKENDEKETKENNTINEENPNTEVTKKENKVYEFFKQYGWWIGTTIVLMCIEAGVFIYIIKKKYVKKEID